MSIKKASAHVEAVELVRASSLVDRVYDALLAQLISLKLAPGSRLSIDALARELDVSQTPVRAALIRLESEGLAIKTHNVGYSAAPLPTGQRFEEIYDLRLLLEPYMAARAAQRITDTECKQLAQMADRMIDSSEADAKLAYGKFARHDADFHSWIADHGDNELAAETLNRLHSHVHLFRLRFHTRVTQEAIKEHAAIVQALLDRNPDKAAQAMAEHISRSKERVAPFFQMLP